jgi:formylglycine-generating enzyme required for sulfatase activity
MKHPIFTSIGLAVLVGVFLVTPARAATTTDSFGGGAFTMDFVDIGNANNPADTTGAPNPVGAVVNTFRMGTYEVSMDVITKANTAGSLGITLQDMTSYGGNGVNRPATGVSWNEAARFVNWLNTSSGSTAAYKFALQPGDVGYSANANIVLWTSGESGYDATNPFRNSNAKYFLPSENEWYKAAYYSGSGSTYYDYPTGSNTAPTAVASGTTAGTAVYGQSAATGPADITNAGGLSTYGTMGQGGNIWEWMETSYNWLALTPGSSRGLRGGSCYDDGNSLASSNRYGYGPSDEYGGIGFRVASSDFAAVPEPRSLLMGLALLTSGLLARNRGKTSL